MKICKAAALCALAAGGVEMPVPASAQALAVTVPGDDFFGYANADWLAATEIPAGRERWTARTEIDASTVPQIAAIFAAAAKAPAGSYARKVADFRAAYVDAAAIEARGLTPLRPLLARIDRIQDTVALTKALGAGLRADVDPLNGGVYDSGHLLGLAVQEGNHGEKDYVAYLLQGGLGLGDRDPYLGADAEAQAARLAYREHLAQVFLLAGYDRTSERATAVLALEIAVAQSHATRAASANDLNADNLWTRADFSLKAPGMDWSAFFTAAGLARQENFVVWQPGAVQGAAALVAAQPLEAWKDYLRARLIDIHAEVLPRAFARQPGNREQRANEATTQALGEVIGRLYVEKYFPAAYKARLTVINDHVVAALRLRVEKLTWLSPASRKVALAKLATAYVGLGYPEKWRDYSTLDIESTDAFGNFERVAHWNYRDALARLGRPVDMTEWRMHPQSVGAVLVFQQNMYNFAAALLQQPKFDPAASDATNYGAIGAILGHDVSHLVDTLGADYDVDGAARRWWTASDFAAYDAAVAPLIRQFDSYRPLPELAVNGKLTLVENLADLGGLNAAFDAHRLALGARVSDREFVRQKDREFFLGFARAWRAKTRADALRTQLTSDGHAPEAFRIATVRNLDAWYEAFDVKPGQRLYLAPADRVRVW